MLLLAVVALVALAASRRSAARCCSPLSTPTSPRRAACPSGRCRWRFLLLLGLTVAATSQITGVLLVFALLVMPAASAQALTARPLASLALSVALGLVVVWLGLGLAYFSIYPAGFFVATVAFGDLRLGASDCLCSGAPARGPPRKRRGPPGLIA